MPDGGPAFGGTLRMANAPRGDSPGTPSHVIVVAHAAGTRSGGDLGAASPQWSSDPVETPKARVPAVVMGVLAVLVVGALAAFWLLR
jgi:hypothetical protein